MFWSFQATWSVPDRWNGMPMICTSAPDLRAASSFGTQLIPNSAPPPATTVAGTMSTPPGRIVTSRPWSAKNPWSLAAK